VSFSDRLALLRLGGFNDRQHAAVHFANQHGHARTLRPIALHIFLRSRRLSMGFGEPTYGAYCNLNPIMGFPCDEME
jgi:hypothetical protein